MLPVIAIIGRPNVGKSTLFNQVTKTRRALVVDLPGVTRDRQFGEGQCGEQRFILIDTGGLGEVEGIWEHVTQQTWQAVHEADVVWFVVDAQAGVTAADDAVVRQLRQIKKPITVVVNKIDGHDLNTTVSEFYRMGLGHPIGVSASQNRGIQNLLEHSLSLFTPQQTASSPAVPETAEPVVEEPTESQGIKLAIVGKPNVGKSTLVNRLLGEERVIAFDAPGTTRDSIHIPFERQEKRYILIDTAGVRRRARVQETLEKFSVIKTLQAIEECHVAVLVIDGQEGLTDQDLALLQFVIEAGKCLVIAVNKWDGLSEDKKNVVKNMLADRLRFAQFAVIHYISALHGSGVGDLWRLVNKAHAAATKPLSTALLTRLLQQAVVQHQPPMVRGRRIKLRYAHAGGQSPPVIVIHGNQTEGLPESYRRYLITYFHKALSLQGTPVSVVFKTSENPFAGRRNTLTPRQEYQRQRLMKHVKRTKRK